MSIHPVIRGLHDGGLAAWAGGSLMGAVGLNGAVALLDDPAQRARASTAGWTRWAPVNAAAVGAHLIGATGLLVTDWPRVRSQRGVAKSSALKTAATGAALGVAAWSAALNRRMNQAGPVPVAGATEASLSTPPDVAATLRQLKLVQWLNPAVALGLIALGDWQSQQQRATEEAKGRVQRLLAPGAGAGAAAAALAVPVGIGLLARRRRKAAQARPPLGLVDQAPYRSTAASSTTPVATAPIAAPTSTAPTSTAPTTSGVRTPPVATTVPVSHEEPVVEREPVTEANLAESLDGPEMTEREHEVVLHAEEVVVTEDAGTGSAGRTGTSGSTSSRLDGDDTTAL